MNTAQPVRVNNWPHNRLGAFEGFFPVPDSPPREERGEEALRIGQTISGAFAHSGISALGTVFLYSIARESESNLVKIPGYILAAGGALSTVLGLASGVIGGLGELTSLWTDK